MTEQTSAPRQQRLILAASGGGHIRQLLDLESWWRDHPHLVVTEDTALGRSLAARLPVRFVPHFALGQARLGRPWTMIREALLSARESWRIVRHFRPDAVVTTGAGSQLFILLWARLRGARIILIDSFARFDRPSAFARLAGPLAHVRISQSAAAAAQWPGAKLFDPLRLLSGPAPAKEALLFATVGATLPFPRLVELVLAAKAAGQIPEEVVLQVGSGAAQIAAPPGVRIVDELRFDEVQGLLQRAAIVVCHGGTGSLITALRQYCQVIAIPRRFARAEHYDDHQAEIVESFVQRDLIQQAEDADQFAQALLEARSRPPIGATTDMTELRTFLADELYVHG